MKTRDEGGIGGASSTPTPFDKSLTVQPELAADDPRRKENRPIAGVLPTREIQTAQADGKKNDQ